MVEKDKEIPVFSISFVSGIIGLPASTLRYWESCYGLIKPYRTEAGHRLYNSADIEKLRWLSEQIGKGIKSREAHALLAQRLLAHGELKESPVLRHGIMILVAEKDPITADLEKYLLKEEGYKVLVVYDGDKAISEAEDKQPDLIIIDVIVPGTSGIKVCQYLKKNRKTRDIPILVFSMLDFRDEALSAGADAFLLKPIEKLELVEKVKSLLASKTTESVGK